jgi:hypothetical protein
MNKTSLSYTCAFGSLFHLDLFTAMAKTGNHPRSSMHLGEMLRVDPRLLGMLLHSSGFTSPDHHYRSQHLLIETQIRDCVRFVLALSLPNQLLPPLRNFPVRAMLTLSRQITQKHGRHGLSRRDRLGRLQLGGRVEISPQPKPPRRIPILVRFQDVVSLALGKS